MANNVVQLNQSTLLATLSPELRNKLAALQGAQDEMGAGITQGFPVISYKGKVWRVKARGEEKILYRTDEPTTPRAAIEVIIVRASDVISKIFYESGYVEGSTTPPDCWSADGRVPDPAAPKRQATTCAGCPQNAWGSKINNATGSKGKACADSKRLAVVPADDIDNEAMGGPMLLRVPPASLGDTKGYADQMKAIGLPYFAVATRISFDPNEAYPRFVYGATRALTEAELEKVLALRDDPRMDRILSAPIEHVETDGVDTSHAVPPVPGQQVPVPPVGVAPVPRTANGSAITNADPVTGEVKDPAVAPIPENPSPVQASQARAAEVRAKVVDPNAEKRAMMRAIPGMTEDMINLALGPEPQPEPEPEVTVVDPMAEQRKQLRSMGLPEDAIEKALGPDPTAAKGAPEPAPEPEPEDPRRVAMRGMGLSDEQIDKALGFAESGVTPAGNEAEKPKQTRKPRAQKAAPAAPVAEAGPNPPVVANGAPTPAAAPANDAPAPEVENGATGSASFDDLLGQMLGAGTA